MSSRVCRGMGRGSEEEAEKTSGLCSLNVNGTHGLTAGRKINSFFSLSFGMTMRFVNSE